MLTGLRIAITALLVTSSVPSHGAAVTHQVRLNPSLIIEHVTVVPMTKNAPELHDMTVILSSGRIESVGPSATTKVPASIRRVNGSGKWLMPALTDMHAHQENARTLQLVTGNKTIVPSMFDNQDLLLPFVANGVLQIFNPAATAEQVGLRDEIEAGHLLAPHIELAAMVDGSPPIWPVGFSHVATAAEDGRQFVRDMKADGFKFVKIYNKVDYNTFGAILDEARKQGIRVVGHIPGQGENQTERWLQPGFEMVMHAEEFAYQTQDPVHWTDYIARYLELAKRTKTLLCSTLTLDERIVEQMRNPSVLQKRPEIRYVNPATLNLWLFHSPYANATPERIAWVARVVEFNRTLVRAFGDSGLLVFPGTDTVVPGLVAGFSLHDELESLSAAGLSPEQIMTAATRLAADFLGVSTDRGTVEAGKRADLLLLDADPLVNVANTRKIAAVIVSGRYLSRAQLDKMMAALAQRYAAMPPIKDEAPPGIRTGDP